ncbi:hypothetical protein LTS16_009051 [Friedmanniomyces endolithicus]|nr:hypothetical protein LTS16_009051 [Friedmanniomyces endolithicus]
MGSSRSSSAVSVQPLRHVTCDYPPPAIQRNYSRNVKNLEQMAEDMSQGGSDIGEEIRRMNEEQKQRSRQSSLQSSHHGDINVTRGAVGGTLGRIRTDSTSTRSRDRASSNNTPDVTSAARWGGYNPNPASASSVNVARSSSAWSQSLLPRKASASGSSRLGKMVEPALEGQSLHSHLAPGGSLHDGASPAEQVLSRQTSQSSFGKQYDQIAGQIEVSLAYVPPSPPKHGGFLPADGQRGGMVTPPLRPRSTDTYREAEMAFKDFDGVHFSPNMEEYVELDQDGKEVRRVSTRSSGGLSMSAASILNTPRARSISYAEPPPADGMVYYPAPVPRMLNLPKRLSQLPAAKVQAQRRSQVLSQIPPEAMQGAPWIPQMDFGEDGPRPSNHSRESSGSHPKPPGPYLNERMSRANLQTLPPQLRASVFFDRQSVPHDVEVTNKSAVATLDSILAASATAPVNAFTDHPFAGDVRRSTFAPEHVRVRRSTTTPAPSMPAEPETAHKVEKRRSSIGNLLRRSSSGNELAEQLDRRGSRSSMLLDFNEGGKKLQKRRSQMSLGDEVQRHAEGVETSGNDFSEPDLGAGIHAPESPRDAEHEEQRIASGSRLGTLASWQDQDATEGLLEEEDPEEAAPEDGDLGEAEFVQPSTLLAELQIRKANQKSRNRTAATHYPNGMHSTLLQLDAVEQINKNKRMKQHIPLAWEGPTQRQEEQGDEDDEVPLGVLYPGRDGLVSGKKRIGDGKDFQRSLGLMEKRQMEDNEPLASRPNRMLGLPPTFGRAERELARGAGNEHLAGQMDAPAEGNEAEDGEDDTLAERLRKLKTKDALATAVSDVLPKDGSKPVSTFTNDVLSQFAPADAGDEKARSRTGTKGKRAVASVKAQNSAKAGAEETHETEAQEEETLGQRRARLQRERDTEQDQPLNVLRSSLLQKSSNPANLPASTASARIPSQEQQLVQSTLPLSKQTPQLASTNVRPASNHGLNNRLLDAGRPQSARNPSTTFGAQAKGLALAGSFAGGAHSNSLGGGLGMSSPQVAQTSASTPMLPTSGQGSYFASPTAGGMMGYGMQPQAMMSSSTYRPAGLPGGSMTSYGFPAMAVSGYGAPQMPMPYAAGVGMGMGAGMGPPGGLMMLEDPMDARKRAGIDQWRLSVLQGER